MTPDMKAEMRARSSLRARLGPHEFQMTGREAAVAAAFSEWLQHVNIERRAWGDVIADAAATKPEGGGDGPV